MRTTRFVFVASLALTVACASTSSTTTSTTSMGTTGSAAKTTKPGAPIAATGRFVWHDLVTDDLPAAQKFYGDLLGWQFTSVTRQGRPYVIAQYQGHPVAGLVPVAPVANSEVSQWISYQSVPNVDGSVDAVQRGGGRTLVAPVDVESVGRAAVVADPQGAAVGLLRLTAGDPQEPPAPIERTFFWMEYLAREPAAAATFYVDTFGFQQSVTDRVGTTEYIVLSLGRPRAGIMALPRLEMRPTWLPYILVSDPVAMAAQARTLGGMVMLEPNAGIRKGSLAVVIDPSGAIVALQKYPF